MPSHIIPSQLFAKLQSLNAYLVGGALRDFFFLEEKEKIKDFDFVIFQLDDFKSFIKELADLSDSSFVELDNNNQIYRIVNPNWQADFSSPRGPSIEEDLKARDFSVNSIAYEIKTNKIIDPLNGLGDLKALRLTTNNLKNLKDDPLRMLRAYRIACKMNFSIAPEITHWISANNQLINEVAPERISYELWLLLSQKHSFNYLIQMLESGLWEAIFPEFRSQRKIPPNDFHHLPLIEHTFELVNQYENVIISKLPPKVYGEIQEQKMSGISLEAVLKMGCLLHDIAKPNTWEIINGKHTFYGHDSLGAEVSEKIGNRFCWPKQIISCIKDLVNYHLRPFHIAPLESEPTEKAERRFFRKLNHNFYPLIALAWADLLSIRGPSVSEEMIQQSEKRLIDLIQNFENFQNKEKEEPILLKGEKLVQAIELAKLPPSKQIKERLLELRELQLMGKINSEEEAFDWFINEGKTSAK